MKSIEAQIEDYKNARPISQDLHGGKWGYERVNGCLTLSRCVYRFQRAAKLARARDARWVVEMQVATE